MSTDREGGRGGTGRGRGFDYEGGAVADYTPPNAVGMVDQATIDYLLSKNPNLPFRDPVGYYKWIFGDGSVVPSTDPAQDKSQYFAPAGGDTTKFVNQPLNFDKVTPWYQGGADGAWAIPLMVAGAGVADMGGLTNALTPTTSAATGVEAGISPEMLAQLQLSSGTDAALAWTGADAGAGAGALGSLADTSGIAKLIDTGALPTPPPGTYQASQAAAPVTELGQAASASDIARLAATGGIPALQTVANVAKGTSLGDSLSRLLSGTSTAADLAKLGMTAAGAAALLADNPDRTTTSQVQLPDWYTAGSKSALALADKYAALGPDSVAPLSDNENQAIQMAKDSAGNWKPLLDRSGTLADEAAGGIPSIDLSKYMNPYLDNVLTPIARRNELAKAAALNDIKAKAGMRGAFGGSRSTLLEGQTSEAADRNMNEAEANIRSGAFTTGLNAAQSDLNRKLTASGQFRTNASTVGALTDADIANLTSTGGLSRSVAQNKLNAPLTAIGGYATALRGSPGSTSTTTMPEASKIGQAVGGLTALAGASKYGLL